MKLETLLVLSGDQACRHPGLPAFSPSSVLASQRPSVLASQHLSILSLDIRSLKH